MRAAAGPHPEVAAGLLRRSLDYVSGFPFLAATAALARLGAAVVNDNCVLLLAGINSAQAIFSDKEFGALALR